jgi:hypothetical protein
VSNGQNTSPFRDERCEDWEDQADVYANQPSHDPEFLNQQLSFPYPKNGDTVRPAGEGCLNCIHSTYCPALYWFRRYTQREPDNHNGRACLSFSTSKSDIPADLQGPNGIGNDFDRAENARRNCEGVLTEANPNGLSAQVTASNRCC